MQFVDVRIFKTDDIFLFIHIFRLLSNGINQFDEKYLYNVLVSIDLGQKSLHVNIFCE